MAQNTLSNNLKFKIFRGGGDIYCMLTNSITELPAATVYIDVHVQLTGIPKSPVLSYL